MKNLLAGFLIAAFFLSFSACNETGQTSDDVVVHQSAKPVIPPADNAATTSNYDAAIGTGSFTNVTLSKVPDPQKTAIGKTLFESSCSSCHRLTDEAIGGPGLKGITKNFRPEWVLNVITNTNQMMEADPRLKSKAEFYQVKMPQLGLSNDQALAIYEYLRAEQQKGK